ncbi:hypothetical protein DSECCO2_660760 [anaerobic digester metagenome]
MHVLVDQVTAGLADELRPAPGLVEAEVQLRRDGGDERIEVDERLSVHLPERVAGGDAFAAHDRPEAPDERGKVVVPVDDVRIVDIADDAERHQHEAGKQEYDAGVDAEEDEQESDRRRDRHDEALHPPDDTLFF